MSKVFEHFIDDLANKSGYGFDELCDYWNEMMNDGDVDVDYFVSVAMEHDF